MRLSHVIPLEAIAIDVPAKDKPQALKFLAKKLSKQSGIDPERIRSALAAREAIGSTGIGRGAAVPHVCFGELQRSYAVFARLDEAIDFDAIDGEPVDLLFAVISPNGPKCGASEPLSILASMSRLLREPSSTQALRTAGSVQAVYDVLLKTDDPVAMVS